MLDDALSATAALWPDIRRAYGWVHRAAKMLKNQPGRSAANVRRSYRGLLGAMQRHRERAGRLSGAVEHFGKVTRNFWPGLFHCYEVQDLPKTNNDLEQFFGRHRYHERRASGRQVASPSLVVRGSARVLAAAATRQRTYTAGELSGANPSDWRALRRQLDERRHQRTQRTRFRRNPKEYLRDVERRFIQSSLLS